jgi:preprotein translocase subunit SecE
MVTQSDMSGCETSFAFWLELTDEASRTCFATKREHREVFGAVATFRLSQ